MSERSRVFGNNVRVYLNKREMEPKQEQIAAELGVTVEALYEVQEDLIYENAGCYECRGEFSKPANKKIIFDLFDTYCDIQGVLIEEGLKEGLAESFT